MALGGALRRLDLCWPVNGMPNSGRKDEPVERAAECEALGVPFVSRSN